MSASIFDLPPARVLTELDTLREGLDQRDQASQASQQRAEDAARRLFE